MASIFSKSSPPLGSRVIHRKPSLDATLTGLVFLSMTMFMGLAAINSQANLLFGVFGLMIGIFIISFFINKRVLKRVSIERSLPDYGVVGTPVTILYTIFNQKRFWPSLSIHIAEIDGAEAFTKQPQAYMLHAAAGESAVVPLEVVPTRRGLQSFGRHQIITSFPFGFIKRAIERSAKDSVIIYPSLGKVDQKLLQMFRSADIAGAHMRPRPGGSDEFFGVKEYRPGENPRHIYWRRSARTGSLVVREMTQVAPPKILILADTYLESDDMDSRALVERVIAMAASLANAALNQGLSVGTLAWDGQWESFQINRGKRHQRDLLGFLAKLPINTTQNTGKLIEQSHELAETDTTLALISSRDIHMSLGDTARGGMVVLSAQSPQARRWISFDPSIDFSQTMPLEQLKPRSNRK